MLVNPLNKAKINDHIFLLNEQAVVNFVFKKNQNQKRANLPLDCVDYILNIL